MTDSETPNLETLKTVDTRICEVTVYTDRARVTRRGTVALTGNETELAIVSLPATLETESVRATGAGTVAVRLLGVRSKRVFSSEPVADRIAEITQLIRKLHTQKRAIGDNLAALKIQLKFVEGLSEKSVGFFSSSIAKQQVGLNETGELLNFLGTNYLKYASAIAQHERQQHELVKQMEALQQHLQQVKTPDSQQSFNIFVAIEPSGSGNFELELSYVVKRVHWTPLYDLRVNTTNNQINLNYLADVQQNTGEDWTGVALILSTAKPGLGSLPPKLEPWYISIFESRQFAGRGVSEDNFLDLEELLEEGYAGNSFQGRGRRIEAEIATAQVSREGGTVSFQVGGNIKIPSDGTPHKVTIFSENYPYQPKYIAVPRLVSFAYLQAVVVNPLTGATLLPGKANIFRDNTFVGTVEIENISPGQEFKLNLGIDE
ncbi:MAG: mucoidy inhibitor MuiA family protein, partial [Microcoleus sp.]